LELNRNLLLFPLCILSAQYVRFSPTHKTNAFALANSLNLKDVSLFLA
jgi:hypothetical protein